MEDTIKNALKNKKLPILVLDQKWHRLFAVHEKSDMIKSLEQELNDLLKRQGQLNIDSKELKKLKSTLMNHIVMNMDGTAEDAKELTSRKLEEDKRLIEEINDKLEQIEDELLDLPAKIAEKNLDLMYESVEACYQTLQDNTHDISEISEWIKQVRIELKKNIIHKQNCEINSKEIYSYMHDILGQEVIEVFDEQHEDIKLAIWQEAYENAQSEE